MCCLHSRPDRNVPVVVAASVEDLVISPGTHLNPTPRTVVYVTVDDPGPRNSLPMNAGLIPGIIFSLSPVMD